MLSIRTISKWDSQFVQVYFHFFHRIIGYLLNSAQSGDRCQSYFLPWALLSLSCELLDRRALCFYQQLIGTGQVSESDTDTSQPSPSAGQPSYCKCLSTSMQFQNVIINGGVFNQGSTFNHYTGFECEFPTVST